MRGVTTATKGVHNGYEGIVGKDPASPYVAGRTLKWLKVKVSPSQTEHEANAHAVEMTKKWIDERS